MRYFTFLELTASATAVRLGIDNTPQADQYCALSMLVEKVLDPARRKYGLPVTVTSGYRCEALNQAVGGAPASQHTKGEAADLSVGDAASNARLARIIFDLGVFDQLILENSNHDGTLCEWVHVSYSRKENRHQVLLKVKGSSGYKLVDRI